MGILSIKRSIDHIDDVKSRAHASIGAYAKVLLALKHAAGVIAGEDGKIFQEHMEIIRSELNPNTPPQTLERGGETVEKELEGFARQRAYVRDQKEWEYKQIIRTVAEAATFMAQTGSAQSQELVQVATQIDSVSRLESIAEVRKQLSHRVTEIKKLATRFQEEAGTRARVLESRMRSVEERLKIAEKLAETDPLTGLGNRRMAEIAMHTAISSGEPLSLIICDLNGFKAVNDRYGHAQGDLLLKSVAREVRNLVRATDVVCRWGGDEFVVLLRNTKLAHAEERAVTIQRFAFGEFLLSLGERKIRVNVTASVGAAEYRPGEEVFEFFERADQMMYERKSRDKATVLQRPVPSNALVF